MRIILILHQLFVKVFSLLHNVILQLVSTPKTLKMPQYQYNLTQYQKDIYM